MKNCCRCEPLVANFKLDGEAIETVAEAITVAKRYAEEDPNQEDATRRSSRVDDRRSEMRYSNTRVSGTKRQWSSPREKIRRSLRHEPALHLPQQGGVPIQAHDWPAPIAQGDREGPAQRE